MSLWVWWTQTCSPWCPSITNRDGMGAITICNRRPLSLLNCAVEEERDVKWLKQFNCPKLFGRRFVYILWAKTGGRTDCISLAHWNCRRWTFLLSPHHWWQQESDVFFLCWKMEGSCTPGAASWWKPSEKYWRCKEWMIKHLAVKNISKITENQSILIFADNGLK